MTTGAERRVARPQRDARHRAREAAVQMLYQWEVGKLALSEVTESFWAMSVASGPVLAEDHREFATSLARGVTGAVDVIDPIIGEAAEHWRIERMTVLDRLILRLAVHELLHQPDTPAKVIINEALELARTFSTDEAVGFINGILDAIRRRLERE